MRDPWLRALPVVLGALCLALVSCRERADVESPRPPAGPVPLRLSSAAPPAPAGLVGAVGASPLAIEPAASAEPVPSANPEVAPRPVVLAVGGDVNFGRECGQAILKDPSYDPFTGLGEAWTGADARVVNLESQLSDQNGVTQNPGNRLIFTGPPGGAAVLARARISLVSLANNHAWDYGKSAFFETLDNLERAQVDYAGAGRDVARAYAPAVLRVGDLSIAVFAVTHIWNQGVMALHEGRDYVAWADAARLKAGIEAARREHDFVWVTYHGGAEYVAAPTDATRRFVDQVMAMGVDVFIGHHPHVLQGVGWLDGRPVAYSLGNFVFAGHDDRPWTKASFFARVTLQKGQPPKLAACPYAIEGHRPRSLSFEREQLAFERFRLHLIGTSASVGGAEVAKPDALGCLEVTAKPATAKSARQPSLSSSN